MEVEDWEGADGRGGDQCLRVVVMVTTEVRERDWGSAASEPPADESDSNGRKPPPSTTFASRPKRAVLVSLASLVGGRGRAPLPPRAAEADAGDGESEWQ